MASSDGDTITPEVIYELINAHRRSQVIPLSFMSHGVIPVYGVTCQYWRFLCVYSLFFKYSDVLPEFSRRCSHQVLFSAVELGIIDLLAQAGGGRSGGLTGEQVAQGIQLMGGSSSGGRAEGGGVGTPALAPATEPSSNVESVGRLLDACVAVGLVAVVALFADGLGEDGVGVPFPQRDGGGGVGGKIDQQDGASGTAASLNDRSRGGGNEIGVIGASPLAPEPMTLQPRRPRRYRLTPVSERYLTSVSKSSLAGGAVWVCDSPTLSHSSNISSPLPLRLAIYPSLSVALSSPLCRLCPKYPPPPPGRLCGPQQSHVLPAVSAARGLRAGRAQRVAGSVWHVGS